MQIPEISCGRLIIVAAVCAAVASSTGAQPDLLWGAQFGTSSTERIDAAAADGAGGVFVTGYTQGSLGGQNAGGSDVFLARLDGPGDPAWTRQFGTGMDDFAITLAPDGAGGVYVAGDTWADLGGPNDPGDMDAWFARYDGGGNRIWITQFGADGAADSATELTPDGAGGVFIGGYTYGDPGGPNAGQTDAWLARYNAAGDRAWIVQLGSSGRDYSGGLAPDGAGGAFFGGYTFGSLGGQNAGRDDIWVARFDGTGKRLWLTQFGSSEYEEVLDLAPDSAGGVYIAGWTDGDLAAPHAGGNDVFLARYDSTGGQTWVTQFGTTETDSARALLPDGVGGVLVAGCTYGSLGGPGDSDGDAWVARYDGEGLEAWITQFGSKLYDDGRGLASDGNGGFFIAGGTDGSLYGQQEGNADAFVARFVAACYADFTGDGSLDLFDFLAFVNLFNAGDLRADCVPDGALDLFDFLCFVNGFNQGC